MVALPNTGRRLRYVPKLPGFSSGQDSVVLIGDAAHAIPPSVGQSGSMALEDAETLAETLSFFAANSSTHTLKQLLQKWDSTRGNRVEQVVARTKAGSELRKVATDSLKKEKDITELNKEEVLTWLYSYDAREFHNVLIA